jgi:hypothetical protein
MFPTEQDKLQLRNSIRLKFKYTEEKNEAQITYVLDLVVNCKSKKQAEAIVNNCDTTNQVKLLSDYGFGNIANNSPQTIKQAITDAPAAIHAQQQINTHINGYLTAISTKYTRHTAGTLTDALPMMDGQRNVARVYNNAQQKLPLGRDYVEWYPKLSSTQNSAGKRFFTSRGMAGLWYTEHGTHNVNTLEWYRLDGTNWKRF